MAAPAVLPIRRSAGEPSTLSNTAEVTTRHISFDWEVDFQAKQVRGTATLTVEALQATEQLLLDTRDLRVASVDVDGAPAEFSLGEASPAFGAALRVPLGGTAAGAKRTVCVRYATDPASTALSWLAPEQTDGKKHPYLFSQCQAIHARSLFPCQDSPGVRATYDAAVKVPSPLLALMSALAQGGPEEAGGGLTVTRWRQPVPIASYLVALVVGDLHKRDISPRVAVWSEAPLVDKAAHDFQDTEKVVAIGERLVGPYVWGRYDVVALPGSFPYGGMENPCLTFVSPSIVTGDGSLFNVVAHEVAHSWTGNLVGPRSWEEMYLNEGFTMFLERRIMSEVVGRHYFDFDAVEGSHALEEAVALFGADHPYTALRPDLKGVDPDDSFSSVPYEKGFAFVCYLRSVVGDEGLFDEWLASYIQAHQHRAIDTEVMVGHLMWFFSTANPAHKKVVSFDGVDWAAWLDAPGGAPVLPLKESELLKGCCALAEKWKRLAQGEDVAVEAADIAGWTSSQVVCTFGQFKEFHQGKAGAVPPAVLTKLNDAYGFNETPNSEILFQWLMLCIKNGWKGHEAKLESLLGRIGRMKFTLPLYRALKEMDEAAAKALFAKNRSMYHPITTKMVSKFLE